MLTVTVFVAALTALAALVYWKLRVAAPCSIVILLKEFRPLSKEALACVAAKETGMPVIPLHSGEQSKSGNWIAGVSGEFLLRAGERDYSIRCSAAPFSGEASWKTLNDGLRKSAASHKAWIAVEILSGFDPEGYRFVARLVSRLLDQRALALYHPPARQLAPVTSETAALLRSGEPIRQLFDSGDTELTEPVLNHTESVS